MLIQDEEDDPYKDSDKDLYDSEEEEVEDKVHERDTDDYWATELI